ncbi:MAG: glycosyltransferase family 4 protein [Muribaculaceae bacterium]|nr:glycosyltransferase family 4 protein [Muribaculaceae bacterium]
MKIKDKKPTIWAFHLYNDFSGSPKVLTDVLEGLLDMEYQVLLFSSRGGVLDYLKKYEGIEFNEVPYKFYANSALKTILAFIKANILDFCKVLFSNRRGERVIYINTILPFGAALAGKIRGNRVIYHYHENSQVKGRIYRLLTGIMKRVADKIICVSATQQKMLGVTDKAVVVANGIRDNFRKSLEPNFIEAFKRKNILLLASLKEYKGVREFITLAKWLPQYNFTLVLNESEDQCQNFMIKEKAEKILNLKVFSRSEDVIPFYNAASIVVNMSDNRFFIETFGLTILEGMSAGLPVIAPTVGGPAELVKDDYNGRKVDVTDLNGIKNTIIQWLEDEDLYVSLAANALESTVGYTSENMVTSICHIIEDKK